MDKQTDQGVEQKHEWTVSMETCSQDKWTGGGKK